MSTGQKPNDIRYVYDYVRDVSLGMNAGIDPALLPQSQLAFLRNGTVRGSFVTHRPAYFDRTLSYSTPSIQTPFETGFFQGAGYYKPDFGAESIIVASSGRLFQIAIAGDTGTVSEISISGDLNLTTQQSWMEQAEKWMIVNDGQHLPIFFDGNTSRRSLGPATQVGTINAGGFAAPAQGSTVDVTMTSTFSGPFNVPLRVTNPSGGVTGLFQAVKTGTGFTGYAVTLTNVTDTPGVNELSGSDVLQSTVAGTVAIQFNSGGFDVSAMRLYVQGTTLPNVSLGDPVIVPCDFSGGAGTNVQQKPGTVGAIFAQDGTGYYSIRIDLDATIPAASPFVVTVGTQIISSASPTLVAKLAATIVAPAVGNTVSALFDRAYTGALPVYVSINGKQYQITSIPSNTPSTAVVLLNLTAHMGDAFKNSTVVTLAELPAGRMGAYGLGRVWQSLTDGRSFVGGDIVGGPSGTAAYQKRDAVLKMQENDLLNGGGTFVVPGQVGDIQAMIFSSVLDASLGQGPLEVITPKVAFSCQAPADRTKWQNLTNPILTESMKGGAGTGQNSTIVFNSDILMRSNYGDRSYIQARRDFDLWGNVPQSREVDPFLATDDPSLLRYASRVEFDNRSLLTNAPVQSQFGVYWQRLIVLNADPLSSLRGKAPSVYEGYWDGLNVLQLVKGDFAGVERCFAICVSFDLTRIKLVEILKSADSDFQDNGTTPIQWEYYTSALKFGQEDPRGRNFIRLIDGEMRCDDLNETLFNQSITVPHNVTFETFYRPDQNPSWVAWRNWTESYDPNSGTDPGYRNGMGLGEPSGDDMDESVNNRPTREGITFQVRVRVTGHCRVMLHRFKAVKIIVPDFPPPRQ